MNAEPCGVVVGETETIPSFGQYDLRLEVLRDDGVAARHFGPEEKPEVWLIAWVNGGLLGDQVRRVVFPVPFPSVELGERAAAVLEEAFAEVRRLAAEDTPHNCEHLVLTEPVRLSRVDETRHSFCTSCNKHFADHP